MDISRCKHLRVRDHNDYTMDIEKFIQSIEMQFKIDFTSLPQWKELIEVMNIVQTDYKTKIKNAQIRKHKIIQNIYIQNCRPTPSELTEKLARTSKKWKDMKLKLKKRSSFKVESSSIFSCRSLDLSSNGMNNGMGRTESVGEVTSYESRAHPNTEVQSKNVLDERLDTEVELKSLDSYHLPAAICTNQHKLISPLGSIYAHFEKPKNNDVDLELKLDTKENILLPTHTNLIKSYPTEIIISNKTQKKQSTKLLLTNCFTELLYLRFKKLSDSSCFNNMEILPCTPIKLYPGLTAVLKFTYSLNNNNIDNVSSTLQFRISRNVLSELHEEILCIPVKSRFIKSSTITVTETVSIPPNYSWHITPKLGYPKAVVRIKNKDNASYNLYIRKRNVDFIKESDESIKSVEAISPDLDSLDQRNEEKEFDLQSTILSTPINIKQSTHFDEFDDQTDSGNIVDIVVLVLNDLIDVALEPFIFKQTYLRIVPRSSKIVLVYFTKVHHMGCHQSYYDFIFTNTKDCDFTVTKTTKVFADVLPHPITLRPEILDMSKSHTFVYCKDYFEITNSHKIFPVTIKITTTTKMRKIFQIIPIEAFIPSQSSVKFHVMICSSKNKEILGIDDLAYFTIKVLIIGNKSVYHNVPPIFYEIIAPCGAEVKRVYGIKSISESSEVNLSSELQSPCDNLFD